MTTTKYSLVVILMELAHQMRSRRLVLQARWLPCLDNEEADALTNCDFRHSNPAKRIEVDLSQMGFRLLPMLFESGEAYDSELQAARKANKERAAAAAEAARSSDKRRHKAEDSLRELDPW